MKKFLGLAMLGLSVGADAETLDCKAQVPHTVCGSGNISAVLNLSNNTFQSTIGAVACWGVDYQVAGTTKLVASVYPYQGNVTYQLVSKRNSEPFARLIVSPPTNKHGSANRVAILDLDRSGILNGIIIRNSFNLVCTRILNESEKDDFHCLAGNCQDW